jgi:membrane associated rhomboid family serine protease
MAKSGKMSDVAVPVIVFVNIAVYFISQYYPGLAAFFEANFIVSRSGAGHFHLWTFLTSLFYHKDLLHLLLSTVGLMWFGWKLEDMIGTKWFFEYFLVSGFVGAMNHCMISPLIGDPDGQLYGATGPITGIVVLLTLIHQNRKLALGLVRFRMAYAAGLFILLDVLGMLVHGDGASSPIGHGSHVAAALIATIYYHKVLRHRVWRNLMASGENQSLEPCKVVKVGWIIPARDEETYENMTAFLSDVLHLEASESMEPDIDTKIRKFIKFKTPNGSLRLVEPNRLNSAHIYTTPILSLTVDNLASAVRNLDRRKVKLVAPMFRSVDAWAAIYFTAPDGRVYEIRGPYPQ